MAADVTRIESGYQLTRRAEQLSNVFRATSIIGRDP